MRSYSTIYSNLFLFPAGLKKADLFLDVVDVGGGFPSAYPGMTPPDLELYVKVIKEVFEQMPVAMNAQG